MDKERNSMVEVEKNLLCVCVCSPYASESNGVCVTLVMQVSRNAEMSVLCIRRLVKPGPT